MLPPKNPQEEKKHLQEYEAMMKKAKKLEAKKQKETNRKREEKDKKTSYAIYVWENDIIPHWKSRVKDRRTIALWNQGVPPRCRKKVWRLRIGNPLNISKTTFSECTRRVPQGVRNTTTTTNTNNRPLSESHGPPMPIVSTSANTKAYDPYVHHDHLVQQQQQQHQEAPLYTMRRQRRTSSLDVLREHKEDRLGISSTEDEETEDDDRCADFTNFTNISMAERPPSTYSFSSSTHEGGHTKSDSVGGRSAMELESKPSQEDNEDDSIGLEDDNEDDDDDDTSSQDEVDEVDDDKVLKDPTAINFLNKAIDEDILRTLPSLCVFQVRSAYSWSYLYTKILLYSLMVHSLYL
jgi:hypothetical protein